MRTFGVPFMRAALCAVAAIVGGDLRAQVLAAPLPKPVSTLRIIDASGAQVRASVVAEYLRFRGDVLGDHPSFKWCDLPGLPAEIGAMQRVIHDRSPEAAVVITRNSFCRMEGFDRDTIRIDSVNVGPQKATVYARGIKGGYDRREMTELRVLSHMLHWQVIRHSMVSSLPVSHGWR